jgi:hypothetical protein
MYNISSISRKKILIDFTAPILFKEQNIGEMNLSLRYERDLKIKNKYYLIGSSLDKYFERLFFVHKLGEIKSLGSGYEFKGIAIQYKKKVPLLFDDKMIELDRIVLYN